MSWKEEEMFEMVLERKVDTVSHIFDQYLTIFSFVGGRL